MIDLVLNDLRRPAGERFDACLELLILPFGIRNIRLYRFHGSWKNLHYVFFSFIVAEIWVRLNCIYGGFDEDA